jgi:CDP-paratose 2-epimerase
MREHILVTGGAGFVGSSLCIALRHAFPETRVTAFDNLKRRGSEFNLPRLAAEGVLFVHGDVRSQADLAAVRPAPDLIIECSAEPSAQAGYGGSPDYLIHTNLTGCYHCLELARTVRADFIFLSTSRVYPFPELNALAYTEEETRYSLKPEQRVPGASAWGISEKFPLDGPRSLYGMTKLNAELMVEEYADAYGIRFIIDRFGLLTGPYQMAKSDQGVIALWVAAHFYRKPLAYIGFGGSGKQVRDFLHVEDFCDLIVDQIRQFALYQGRRWNAGGGVRHSLSLLEATALCQEITGNTIEIKPRLEDRPADVRIYLTDNRAVSGVNGWSPRRDAAATLGDIHEWLVQEAEQYRGILGE